MNTLDKPLDVQEELDGCAKDTNDLKCGVAPCNRLVCLKHWFFRHYVLVAALILVLAIYLTGTVYKQILPKSEGHWKALAGIVAGVFTLGYFIQKQKLDELHLFKEVFTEFNARYDEMHKDLNRIRESDSVDPITAGDPDRDKLFNYFNLCAEEYLYYRLGYIYPEVWRAWYNGMTFFYANARIRHLWDQDEQTDSYYGLRFDRPPERPSLCCQTL